MAPTLLARAVRSLCVVLALPVFATSLGACASETADDTSANESPERDFIGESSEEQVGWSCTGLTSSKRPADSRYYITSFGCWTDENGKERGDGADNCHPSCEAEARNLCGSGLSWDDCEREIRWYTADADRFGCGAKLKVKNPANGKTVIVAAIDRGPNCRIEKTVKHAVLDLSMEASIFLFGGQRGVGDRAAVVVETVSASTPLGPTTGDGGNDAATEGCPVLTYPSGVRLQTKKDSALTKAYGEAGPQCFLDVDDLYDPVGHVRYATNVRLAANFRLAELATSGLSSSRRVLIDPAFVGRLQALRDLLGPLNVESGYLTPAQVIQRDGAEDGGVTAASLGVSAVLSSGATVQDEIEAALKVGFTTATAKGSNVEVSLEN
jgi:hypothetical protein